MPPRTHPLGIHPAGFPRMRMHGRIRPIPSKALYDAQKNNALWRRGDDAAESMRGNLGGRRRRQMNGGGGVRAQLSLTASLNEIRLWGLLTGDGVRGGGTDCSRGPRVRGDGNMVREGGPIDWTVCRYG